MALEGGDFYCDIYASLIYNYTQRQAETVADFPLIFAAATLMSLPTVFVYLALQRYFVQGLVGVGIKG